MDIESEILEEINKRDCFVFSPEKWERFGATIDRLEQEGVLIRLSSRQSKVFNADYIYVLT